MQTTSKNVLLLLIYLFLGPIMSFFCWSGQWSWHLSCSQLIVQYFVQHSITDQNWEWKSEIAKQHIQYSACGHKTQHLYVKTTLIWVCIQHHWQQLGLHFTARSKGSLLPKIRFTQTIVLFFCFQGVTFKPAVDQQKIVNHIITILLSSVAWVHSVPPQVCMGGLTYQGLARGRGYSGVWQYWLLWGLGGTWQ